MTQDVLRNGYIRREWKSTLFFFGAKSGAERCRLKESVGKLAGSVRCELILTVWGPKNSPPFF